MTPKTIEMAFCPVKCKVLEKAGCQYVNPSDYKGELFTYTFTKEPFRLSLIDKKKSQDKVQNRWNGKINPDYVARYALCMEDGDKFPGIVLFKEGDDWFPADGFHTLEAAEKNGVEYVVGVFMFSAKSPLEVAATFNGRTTGNAEPVAETLEKAVRLYRQREKECLVAGIPAPTQKSWAAKFLLPESRFNLHYRTTATKRELVAEGVNAEKFEDSTLEAIAKMRGYDRAASITVAKLVSQFGIKSHEVKKLEKDFNDPLKNAQQKQAVIDRYTTTLKIATDNGTLSRKCRSRRKSTETTFKESITKIANLSQKVDVTAIKSLMADTTMASAVTQVQKFLKGLNSSN